MTDIIDGTFTTTEEPFGEKITVELKLGGSDAPVADDAKTWLGEVVTIHA